MFTGIIEEVGVIQSLRLFGNRASLQIEAHAVLNDLQIGDSIAVNGTCLTVTAISSNSFFADASRETLRVTNLGGLQQGSRVNLERALRVSDRLDGHLVQGHVDDTARILGMQQDGDTIILSISMPDQIRRYIVPKGSITVDGISLTVNICDDKKFACTIIPHTVHQTNLRFRKIGDVVNLESDIIGRYVENLMQYAQESVPEKKSINMEFLKHHGWE